ncbi:MAG: C13 family peptidase, partial [Pseudomonadota bacterium]|nr:C13 family peptidase [Pseudomonadota bacterium]
FNFAAWVAVAAVRSGFAGDFDSSAIPVYLATVPLTLAAALLIALAYGAPERMLLIATALTASDLVFELAGLGLPALAAATGLTTPLFFALIGWIWATSVRAVLICAGKRRPQVYQGTLVVSAMIAIAFFAFPRTDVWHAPQEQVGDALAEERLFHLQGQLIERSLAAIAPGRPGVTDLYFVGFAPDASQDVFLREMRFVKRLFDERLGTAGRSIALASSHDALEEFPIGSATNLSRALARVGQVMNPDEDVLFLFVSAHGDREHRLSAAQPPLELAALTPTALARMLQDAGIKWRVVVVSACYSGGYIEPLRDDNSLVITAAAPDRSSFGCEAGRDFTYFGQAYFRDALEKTRSFAQAFELAKEIVGKQEAAERLLPSLPQMWIGPGIASRLKGLE